MKFAISYSPTYHGVDPDTMVAYARIGPAEPPPSLPYLDPPAALSFVAWATGRIRLGTGVLLLPYHHPVTLAKRLATVDVLSRGRMRLLTVGLGAGPRVRGRGGPRPRGAGVPANGVDRPPRRSGGGVGRAGVTRIVVTCPATDPGEQSDEMSALARRFGLGDGPPAAQPRGPDRR